MSETNGNGHAPTLAELRESLRRERAATALAKARHERQVYESLDLGMDWSDLRNPWGYRYDGMGRPWLPLSQGGGASAKKDGGNEPFIQSDADLDRMRAAADWLCTKNDLAIGATRTVRNLTVGKGYVWDARPNEGYERDGRAGDLAKQVQRVIAADADRNKLAQCERSACCRAVRDGDAFVRHFRQSDGTTRHRFVRAAQVRDPGTIGPHASFGVECDPDDVITPLYYWITYDGGSSYERVPADEISHLKRNVDEEIKRGLSDFFSAGEAFEDVSKLLRAMRKSGTILASMAYIAQQKNATGDQIRANVAAMQPLNLPRHDNVITGRPQNYQGIVPGERVDVGENTEYKEPPLASGTNNFVGIVQAALRAVGTRWGFPEYFISGDASNNSYSSILVAGSPLVTGIQTDQDDVGVFFLRWRWTAVRNACRAGIIRADFEEVRALVRIHFEPPQVIVADETVQADVDHKDIAAGVMSLQARRNRRGLDNDQQRKELKEEPPTRVTGKTTDLDSKGNPVGQGQGNVASASVGGLQAILSLQTSVYKGEVPRLAAIANAEVVFGFSKEQAAQLFPEVPPQKTADEGQGGAGASPFGESLSFDEADALALLFEARTARKEGEEWETSGRKYKRQGGKTVRVAGKKDEPAAKEKGAGKKAAAEKPTVDDVHAAILEVKGKVTAEHARALGGRIGELTDAQVKELRGKLGMTRGGGAGAKKADRVKGIVDRIAAETGAGEPEASAEERPKEPEKKQEETPAKKEPKQEAPAARLPEGYEHSHTTASGVPVAKGGLGGADLHTAVAPSADAARELAPAIAAAMREAPLYRQWQDGIVPVGQLAHMIMGQAPGATLPQVYAALLHLRDAKAIQTPTLNETGMLGTRDFPLAPGAEGKEDGTIWDRGRPLLVDVMKGSGDPGARVAAATKAPAKAPKEGEPAKAAPSPGDEWAKGPALVAEGEPMPRDRFHDLMRKSGERTGGHGGAKDGFADESAALKTLGLAQQTEAGRKFTGGLAGLARGFGLGNIQTARASWPDAASHAAAVANYAKALSLFTADDARKAAAANDLPHYKARKNEYDPVLDQQDPAYAAFLRDRLDAKPAARSDHPAYRKGAP